MSVGYTWVQWNRHKLIYDAIVAGSVVLYLIVFVAVTKLVWTGPNAISDEVMLLRALGTLAIILLHVILVIGPLARLDRRFLPLLYNRRHLGVTTFGIGLLHGALALLYYQGFGTINPVESILTGNTEFGSFTQFPFELLGIAALLILFLMAATSHDFWNHNLGPAVWKTLHMLVYLAYGLLVAHVALGVLQKERSVIYVVLIGVGLATVVGLHLITGFRERRREGSDGTAATDWFDVGRADDIPVDRAKVVCLKDRERVAVFRHGNAISAVSNVCRHQGGPLGEGRIVDGCITCPWHGWQYRPEDGTAPPPFDEKIPTYEVRIEGGRVKINPEANTPGTPVAPVLMEAADDGSRPDDGLYVGYLPVPAAYRRFLKAVIPALVVSLAGLGAVISGAQSDPGDGAWAYGEEIELEGLVVNTPYAILFTGEPGSYRPVLLVGDGKYGAVDQVGSDDGARVRVTGTAITRDGMRMLSLVPGDEAVERIGDGTPAPAIRAGGPVTLRGEVIDPKCYFGAMKPAHGKTHKACAILCIRGGIPPMFAVWAPDGSADYYLLTDRDGGPAIDLVIPFVGEPVEITGEVEVTDGITYLRVDASGFQSL